MDALKAAIGQRTMELAPEHCEGDFLFDGARTLPENLGWRFIQSYGTPPVAAVLAGEYDEQLRANYYDAAGAEHWYRFEKQWD